MTEGSAGVGATLRAGLSDVGGAVRDCWGALALAAMLSMTASALPSGARFVVALVAGVIAQGALFRRAFARAGGLKGLRWGADEWRLLAAQLMILGLFVLIGSILLIIVGGVALGVARTAAPNFDPSTSEAWRAAFAQAGPAGLIVAIVPLASLFILIWLGLRLSLSAPATVDQAGVRVLSAFPLTRGRTHILLVVGLAISVPVIVLSALLGLAPGQGAVVTGLMAVCTYFYAMPAWTGALAHFYRHGAAQQDA
ncbi:MULTISPECIES: hypothetical protein [unclassified Caulobacter]|jgi:hypothetical protein|uniref:hypothetical protein n=1 Tax=unclassified Caulobacter TaxID=2648921 RepID=UPI000780C2EE|nr:MULTISPECIES: hypothetical protein [unclassified Caulobacter]AZS20549.1 hypothetical protein CSW63_07750 [Caulobacter sp. FWC26]